MLLSWYFVTFLLCFFSPPDLCTASPSLCILSFLAPDYFFIHLLLFSDLENNKLFCLPQSEWIFCSRGLLDVMKKGTWNSSLCISWVLICFWVPQTIAECSWSGNAMRVSRSPEVSVIFLTISWLVIFFCAFRRKKKKGLILLCLCCKDTCAYPIFETLTSIFANLIVVLTAKWK